MKREIIDTTLHGPVFVNSIRLRAEARVADCHGGAHQGGNDPIHSPPIHACFDGRIGPDVFCCVTGITPHSLEISDIHADVPTCSG